MFLTTYQTTSQERPVQRRRLVSDGRDHTSSSLPSIPSSWPPLKPKAVHLQSNISVLGAVALRVHTSPNRIRGRIGRGLGAEVGSIRIQATESEQSGSLK